MSRIARILCPIDFSEFSRNALHLASAIARWYAADVTALHVLPSITALMPPAGEGIYPPLVFSDEDLQQFRDELAAFARESGDVPIAPSVVQGNPVNEIVRCAGELPADLVVMGTHGRSGFERLLLGSVTEKLLRRAPCPVLTVPRRAPDVSPLKSPFTRVLCAVDFSPASLQALALAQSLAGRAAARLRVLHVLEPVSIFEPVAASGRVPAVDAELRRDVSHRLDALITDDTRAFTDVGEVVAAGKPYKEILRIAEEQRADLIVMGTHGGPRGLPAFGSTTAHVVREASCPVLTVHA